MNTVIIPAYQPDEKMIKLVDELWLYGNRIVVVDDGSRAECAEIFEQVSDVCIVLHHKENKGKGAAIKTALRYIESEMWDTDVIGIMDCDGQHLPKDMQKVLQSAVKYPEQLVLGVRKVGKEMPFRSRFGNELTRKLFKLVTKTEVSDTQTGLRAFHFRFLRQMLKIEGERYEYEMNVLLFFAKAGIGIKEVEIETIYHDSSNSCSHFNVISDSIRIYKKLISFFLSSFSSFFVDYLLFFVFMMIFPRTAPFILFANIGARMISAFYNYSMNCRFVFHTRRQVKNGMEYLILACWILIFNNLILEFLTQGCGLSVYPAKLLTECILFCMSWLMQERVIFKKEERLRKNHEIGIQKIS